MHKPVNRLYPLKSTCLYVAVALLVDLWALVQRASPASDRALIWSGGGIFVYVPWGRPAVVVSAILGLGIGATMAVLLRLVIDRRVSVLADQVAIGHNWGESAMLAAWLATAAVAYFLGDALLFPRLSGTVAAMNVFAARIIIHPSLVAIYETAAEKQAMARPAVEVEEWRAAA